MVSILRKKVITITIIIVFFLMIIYSPITGHPLNRNYMINNIENNKVKNPLYFVEENETFYDSTGDVINFSSGDIIQHHPNVDVKNIDITKLEYNRVEKSVCLSLNVYGQIEDRGDIEILSLFGWDYNFSFELDSVIYLFVLSTNNEDYSIGYVNQNCSIMYGSTSETVNISKDDFYISDDLLVISFELLTANETYEFTSVQANYIKFDLENINESNLTFLYDEAPDPPLLVFAEGPNWGLVGQEIKFQGFVLYGSPPYSYYWDFGDGINSTEKHPTHIYKRGGEYNYSLTVTDKSGISSSDNGTIVIEKRSFVVGLVENKSVDGNYTYFYAKNIWTISSSPFSINHYSKGEKLIIFNKYKGIVTKRFICGLFSIFPTGSTIYSINVFEKDDDANKVIWLVSGVDGTPVEINHIKSLLLNESGKNQPNAEITFKDVNADELITPGDTFTVVAPFDGYFVFMITHKISGATIFKSSLTKY